MTGTLSVVGSVSASRSVHSERFDCKRFSDLNFRANYNLRAFCTSTRANASYMCGGVVQLKHSKLPVL